MEKVRYGIIGVGGMGTNHVKRFIKPGNIPNAVLTAVCDVKQERLDAVREVCKEQGGDELADSIKYFTDSHELITSGLCDAVLIATPHYAHPVIAIDAFENGLHVLSEKPIGVYTKKIYELIEVAKKSGKAFGIMYNQRTSGFYQKMREIVKSGELGELKRCVWIITNWYRTQAYYNSGGWRATWAGEGGGVLINQCPHNIDLWQWIFGMPNEIFSDCSVGKYHDIEVEDDVTTMAKYENGATAVFITTTGEFPGTNRLEITGSKGKLVYENNKLVHHKLDCDEREFTFDAKEGFAKPGVEIIEYDIPQGHGRQHDGIVINFTNHILNGEELLAPGYEGINGLSISNAMMLSSWKKEWVSLPNDGEEFWTHLQERIKTSKLKEDVSIIMNTEGTYGNN